MARDAHEAHDDHGDVEEGDDLAHRLAPVALGDEHRAPPEHLAVVGARPLVEDGEHDERSAEESERRKGRPQRGGHVGGRAVERFPERVGNVVDESGNDAAEEGERDPEAREEEERRHRSILAPEGSSRGRGQSAPEVRRRAGEG